MKIYPRLISLIIIVFVLIGCSSKELTVQDEQKSVSASSKQLKQSVSIPQEFNDNHPENYDILSFSRYNIMLIDALDRYHRVNGKMPVNLNEFFTSDFCLVHPVEIHSGLPFKESASLDANHPENLVYEYIDEDTANLKFCLKTIDGDDYFYSYPYTRERFWSFFPRDANGQDADIWAAREKTKPPKTSKKAKEMLSQLQNLFGWAVSDYFNAHHSFPANFDELFRMKWGKFRNEPWANYQYDDPAKRLPNKTFGFDKTRNVYYIHSEFERGFENDYAMQLPVNFIETGDTPLLMHEISDISSLKIDIFADTESLIKSSV